MVRNEDYGGGETGAKVRMREGVDWMGWQRGVARGQSKCAGLGAIHTRRRGTHWRAMGYLRRVHATTSEICRALKQMCGPAQHAKHLPSLATV